KQAIANFYKQDAGGHLLSVAVSAVGQAGGLPHPWQAGWTAETMIKPSNLDLIYAMLIQRSPAIKQAEAKLLQTQRDLDQAKLNIRYCDILSEIDSVVTRRNVNPANNVSVVHTLMAFRSLTEIWIDPNS